jgi:hypothetical protein
MLVLEHLQEYARRGPGLRRPGRHTASDLAWGRQAYAVRFDDDRASNHPRWELIIHRGTVDLHGPRHPATVMEDVFDFGGNKRWVFTLKAGDVAILASGTGQQYLFTAANFLVVGAHPPVGTYDECTTVEDRPRALKTIPKVLVPRNDPVYGSGGPLSKLWKKAK